MSELTLEMLHNELRPVLSELAFIRAQLVIIGSALDVLQRGVRMTRVAAVEFAKTNVTSSEVEVLREDLQRVMAKQDDFEARLLVLETEE